MHGVPTQGSQETPGDSIETAAHGTVMTVEPTLEELQVISYLNVI